MLAALVGFAAFPGLYDWITAWGDGGAERYRYAEFLDEAAILLERNSLSEVGTIFRESGDVWKEFGDIALPEDIALLSEARNLLIRRQKAFLENGSDAEGDLRKINIDLKKLFNGAKQGFSDETQAAELRETMSEAVNRIHQIEAHAIEALQSAMS